ncbi:BrnT family toxin [Adlercreutzia sp. ZJ242]|uniref:BrnT family toxin n=1 Tax=Adlercreutzia sp. ZJ242 TaxID=2709409 RepID=UPI0013EB4098|nr:BrnT family toxin [Adlercreutzia sp. ZJ242]
MIFEFDEGKNGSNIEKHKVSFEEAQVIWEDPDLMVISARKRGERRQMAIGRAYAVMFSVVHTKRGEAVRIISARRSTKKEVQRYEQNRNRR